MLQSLVTVVSLEQRDHLGRPVLGVLQSTELDDGNESDSGLHVGVGELLLHELERGDGDSELNTLQSIVTGENDGLLEGTQNSETIRENHVSLRLYLNRPKHDTHAIP